MSGSRQQIQGIKDTRRKFSFLHNCTTIIKHNDHHMYIIDIHTHLVHGANTNRGKVVWLHYTAGTHSQNISGVNL